MKLVLVVLTITALINGGFCCSRIENPSATISVHGSDLTLKWKNNRPDASGTINGEVIKGWVDFPDDRNFTFI